ncbi:thioredoxin family protein [Streptomyces sp. NPDC059118]|uniref:thioredoxin family protein n=1 Tax=unclassified Streptomyces TaxID=2593676 RepID=UPI0036AF533C
MRITVPTVPGCPNSPVVQERIIAALAGQQAEVEVVEVFGREEAERVGMTGSPTVLLNGLDSFAQAGAVPSVSRRIYREAEDRADGAPSVKALGEALAAVELTGAAGKDCCGLDAFGLVGRDGRGRVAPVGCGLRAAGCGLRAAGCGLRIRRCYGTSPPLAVLPIRMCWNRSRLTSTTGRRTCSPNWPERTS